MPELGIPALVISGFLGSGKTTLVRHLLRDAQRTGRRLAVVSNELGSLGIDRALLGGAGEAYVELEGGCVCCKLSSELVDSLQMLRTRARPDAVVVETSGVALPIEVQLHFWKPPLSEWVSDDVAIVVVNAEQLREGRDLDATFETQVSSADLLLLNQIDRVPARELDELEARLRAIEPAAPILRTVQADVPPDLLLPPDAGALRSRRRATPAAPAPHTHEDFVTDVIEFADGVSEQQILDTLMGRRALRAKGFVRTGAGLRLVQVVGRRVELQPLAPSADPPAHLVNRVVLIARVP